MKEMNGMIRYLIDDYEKNFINLKNDLINEIEKLEIKNINLSNELKKLQKKLSAFRHMLCIRRPL